MFAARCGFKGDYRQWPICCRRTSSSFMWLPECLCVCVCVCLLEGEYGHTREPSLMSRLYFQPKGQLRPPAGQLKNRGEPKVGIGLLCRMWEKKEEFDVLIDSYLL